MTTLSREDRPMNRECTWCGHAHDVVTGECRREITVHGGDRVPCPCRYSAWLDALRKRRCKASR